MDSELFRFLLLLFLINLVFRLVRRLREPAVDPFYNMLLAADAILCGYGLSSAQNVYSVWSLLGMFIFIGAILIPGIFGLFTHVAMNRTQWSLALRLAQLRHLFAPTQEARVQIEHIERLQKAHLGNVADLERDLAAEIARSPEPQRRLLQETLVELLAFSGQWERCLETFSRMQANPEDMEISRPTLAVALIRASLEMRDAKRAWRFYEELRRFEPADPTVVSALLSAEIMFLAFHGASETLERTLYPAHRAHPVFSVASKRYWLGLAHLQEGNTEKASKYLDFPKKIEAENPVLGKLARQHLEEGPAPLELPSPAHEAELRQMAQRVPRMFLQIRGPKPPVATGLFLAVMLLAFAAQEFLGGTGDLWALFRLGANFRHLAMDEPFRLVLAMFLHAGVLHLLLNGLMLFLFGRMLEAHFGFLRTISIFVISGVAGNAASALIYREGVSIGASSAVFGMLGATLMLFVVARDMWHPLFRKKQIYNLVFLLLLNFVLGFSMPMIDNAAHVGGFLGGSFLGWFFLALGASTPARRNLARALGIGSVALGIAAVAQMPVLTGSVRMQTVSWTQDGRRVRFESPVFWEIRGKTLQNAACRIMPTFSVLYMPKDALFPTDDAQIRRFLDSYLRSQSNYRMEEKGRRVVDGLGTVVDLRFHFQGRPGMETLYLRIDSDGLWCLRFVYESGCADSVESFMKRVAESFVAEPLTR